VTNPDWATIASLATAGGTLALAISTFASVKSANRAARAAERSLLAGLRPLLVPSRLQDAEQKVLFSDDEHPCPEFRRQSRDIYIPAGEMGSGRLPSGIRRTRSTPAR
jgi:hypothetical protein